ncbi:efflux RND transporter periplasmic adaptor subunit [Roseovarius sp. Pro17]|uniref:efflux RND transporter periplasmic adaptor subunit n=1 Tax=Roseovarius sp. Pro17 TaxID=3108175 RepID=UPI002D795997|nr:HlyD family efflux transporter periplasmic adaptor subunit [Roseovarius sp. Pro17]
MLQLDADLRRVETERELIYYLANETRSVLGFRQAFVLRKRRNWSLEAVSSVTNFDRNAPINRQIQQLVSNLSKGPDDGKVQRLRLDADDRLDALCQHMFLNAVWMPLKTREGTAFAGLLILHENEWSDGAVPLLERVAEAGAHAWWALKGRALTRRRWLPGRIVMPIVLLLLFAAGFWQAPLTVLAPAEVSGRHSVAISVPMEGVIDSIEVTPNQPVTAGMVLARLEDTELRNALAIAERKVTVADARLSQLQNASFADPTAARELKVAAAEFALAQSERELAQERLARTEIVTKIDGIAVFDDPQALTGRPVSVGERLMEVVSPDSLEFTIRLPVIDNINLYEGSKVRVFLDSDPLSPIKATLSRTSYRAVTQPDGSFAYTLAARMQDDPELQEVRIGAYGTAQLYGQYHSIHFIIFRRPLSWLRQTFGV